MHTQHIIKSTYANTLCVLLEAVSREARVWTVERMDWRSEVQGDCSENESSFPGLSTFRYTSELRCDDIKHRVLAAVMQCL